MSWQRRPRAPAGKEILQVCTEVADMLLDKNISYGNSALSPINIFSKAMRRAVAHEN